MTHQDFIAWLDGYLTGCGDKPDAAVIRAKMAEAKAPATTLLWGTDLKPFIQPATSGTLPLPPMPYTTC